MTGVRNYDVILFSLGNCSLLLKLKFSVLEILLIIDSVVM